MKDHFAPILAHMRGDLQPAHDVGPSEEFDPFDDEQMERLFGKRIGKPVGDLLQLYRDVKLAKGSFGMDDARFAERVMPILKQLAEGAVEVFKEDM